MKPIPLEHIESGRKKVLDNARSLIAEAELLLQHGYVARAYTLAHIAGEELAKLPMFVRAGMEAALGSEVDWKRLQKKAISHTKKLDGLHTLDYMFSEIRADDSDLTAYIEATKTTPA